jgi:hypothetical protein
LAGCAQWAKLQLASSRQQVETLMMWRGRLLCWSIAMCLLLVSATVTMKTNERS